MANVICHLITGCVIVATALTSSVAAADDTATVEPVNLRLTLRDTDTGQLVPGRITVEQHTGRGPHVYHFVKSLDPAGTAIKYDVTRGPDSFEKHTTVSAHPFGANVPPGYYVIYYEHGPEWRGNKAQVQVKEGIVTEQELPISRWIDMNERGWYSGDTHVHRTVEDLPNIMRAEDLNVALPLSYWVRDAYTPPGQGDKTMSGIKPGLITVDPSRVIWPMNTEYELFTINGQRHTQGAVFVLNHQQPLTLPAPPVGPIVAEARRQGALLDLDKHSWPWSMMLVPIMDVDLFELANNHIWRTGFFFKNWPPEMRPTGWNIETDADGFTEWGWIDFGFKSYYALLNCGFKMRPTAGTANGVHPVPLGYGRIYVECPDGSSVPATALPVDQRLKPTRQETESAGKGFSYDNWMKNLDAGRSFVTTGPMLFTKVNGQPPGSTVNVDGPTTVRVKGSIETINGNQRVEIVKNGLVVKVLTLDWEYESPWIWRSQFDVEVPVDGTSWIAVRCFAGDEIDGRQKLLFAHSSPIHIEMPGKPLRPRKIETDYFIRRMEEEIVRNRDLLQPDEIAEYERARDIYQRIAETAIDDAPTTNEELLSLVIPADELPPGWQLTDISKTELDVLGSNPAIISRPDMVRGLSGMSRASMLKESNVSRILIALYQHAPNKQAVSVYAHVCADEQSAKATAEFLKNPPNIGGRFQTWQRGDLAISMIASKEMSDDVLESWIQRIETKLQ